MSDPGFARPDLCSIRTAYEQDELAKPIRGGFGAMGSALRRRRAMRFTTSARSRSRRTTSP